MLLSRPVYVTHKGFDELEEELKFLQQVKRPEIIERLHAVAALAAHVIAPGPSIGLGHRRVALLLRIGPDLMS